MKPNFVRWHSQYAADCDFCQQVFPEFAKLGQVFPWPSLSLVLGVKLPSFAIMPDHIHLFIWSFGKATIAVIMRIGADGSSLVLLTNNEDNFYYSPG